MDQIMCKKHKSESITIFCTNSQCMMELCASCVADHAEYHNYMKSKPHFQNIKQAISVGNERLQTQKNGMNQLKDRLKLLIDRVDRQKSQVGQIFKLVKTQVINTVDRVFEQMRQEVCNQIDQEIAKNGLGDRQKLQKMYSKVCQQHIQLHQCTQSLYKNFKHGLLKQINLEFIPENISFYQNFQKQITRNQLFKAQANYQAFSIKDIQASIRQLISITFSIPASKANQTLIRSRSNQSFVSKSPLKPLIQSPQNYHAPQFSKTEPYGFQKSTSRNSGLELYSKFKENRMSNSQFLRTAPL